MTTFLFVALAFAFGFTAGLAWRWYEGEDEVRGDTLTPLRCAQLNATVIWCGIQGLARAIFAQAKVCVAKIRNRK